MAAWLRVLQLGLVMSGRLPKVASAVQQKLRVSLRIPKLPQRMPKLGPQSEGSSQLRLSRGHASLGTQGIAAPRSGSGVWGPGPAAVKLPRAPPFMLGAGRQPSTQAARRLLPRLRGALAPPVPAQVELLDAHACADFLSSLGFIRSRNPCQPQLAT